MREYGVALMRMFCLLRRAAEDRDTAVGPVRFFLMTGSPSLMTLPLDSLERETAYSLAVLT
jgi:hypothetical protein